MKGNFCAKLWLGMGCAADYGVGMSMPTSGAWESLKILLEARLRVIADHELRERDAAAHLEQLREVSMRLMAEQERLEGALPPRLKHFLAQASYGKALDWIREQDSVNP
jgi:hypothetical protein